MRLTFDIRVADADGLEIEELFVAREQLRIVDEGYQGLKIQTPEWVTDRMSVITREITSRVTAELTKRLRAAKARAEGYKTPAEKRKDAVAEIAELEALLNP